MNETSISRERAQKILANLGRAEDYDPVGDYYIATDEDGCEMLTCGGLDAPLAINGTETSWLGS